MTSYLKPPKVKRAKGRARPNEPLADWCELGLLPFCDGRAVHRHHRLSRAQGGSDESSNLLDVCASCHAYAHANPSMAYRNGWLLHARAGDNQRENTQ